MQVADILEFSLVQQSQEPVNGVVLPVQTGRAVTKSPNMTLYLSSSRMLWLHMYMDQRNDTIKVNNTPQNYHHTTSCPGEERGKMRIFIYSHSSVHFALAANCLHLVCLLGLHAYKTSA